jgi:isoquinoline 1-oxidoreductase beta subunit
MRDLHAYPDGHCRRIEGPAMTSTADLRARQRETPVSDGDSGRFLPTRRALLKGVGSTAFLLAFSLPVSAKQARAGAMVAQDAPSGLPLNAFLAIGSDNAVTAIIAQTEGGQGNSTGITQVLAAELGADWSLMRYQFTSERLPVYINPTLYEGLVITAGSSSISGFYKTFRNAAATTREMLTTAAAQHWKVQASECVAANSFVTHRPSKRRLSFAQLAAPAAKLTVPKEPGLRALVDMPLIGQEVSRLDVPYKVNGSARFGFDADVPEMLYAAVRHGSAYGSVVATIDAETARTMPGVRLVMAIPQGVAVVADQYWQAASALAEVKETYKDHPNLRQSSATVQASLEKAMKEKGDTAFGVHGDFPGALKSAAKVFEGDFSFAILAHAPIEPVSCTAHVVGDHCELWLSTKSSTLDAGFAAKALGIDPGTVKIHNEFQGGDFGRRSGKDHTTEAVLISRAAGKPVKVVWTRAEDLRMDQHRTALLGHARMGLDSEGMPVAFESHIASDGVWRALFPEWYAMKKPLDLPIFGLVGSAYGIPNEAGSYAVTPMPVRVGAFRGNAEVHNGFILESMVDQAAFMVGQDPVAYRRRMLSRDPRNVAVLDRVAKMAKWGVGQNRAMGVAFYTSDFYKCRLAVIVEIINSPEGMKVKNIFAACDSGLVINPKLARQCIEGGLLFGLSNALYEEITLKDGAPEQTNFNTYRVLRMNEAPDVFVEVLSVGEEPGSFGEVGTFPVGVALSNAIFASTGQRMRTQPFVKHGLKML